MIPLWGCSIALQGCARAEQAQTCCSLSPCRHRAGAGPGLPPQTATTQSFPFATCSGLRASNSILPFPSLRSQLYSVTRLTAPILFNKLWLFSRLQETRARTWPVSAKLAASYGQTPAAQPSWCRSDLLGCAVPLMALWAAGSRGHSAQRLQARAVGLRWCAASQPRPARPGDGWPAAQPHPAAILAVEGRWWLGSALPLACLQLLGPSTTKWQGPPAPFLPESVATATAGGDKLHRRRFSCLRAATTCLPGAGEAQTTRTSGSFC